MPHQKNDKISSALPFFPFGATFLFSEDASPFTLFAQLGFISQDLTCFVCLFLVRYLDSGARHG